MFKKEGPKVLGYYTTKRCILGAAEGFIWTIIAQHLIIYIKVLKYAPLKFILRQLYFNINFADLGYFRPTLTNFLHKNALYWLNFWSIDPLKIPMGSLDSIIQYFGISRDIFGEKIYWARVFSWGVQTKKMFQLVSQCHYLTFCPLIPKLCSVKSEH